MSGEAMLRSRDVVVAFGGVAAVDQVSLDVLGGEVMALVGPNGSGKTSFLNACSGFVPVLSGSIELAGQPVTRTPSHRRFRKGLGRSFQNPHTVGLSTVLDLMQFGSFRFDRRSFTRAVFRPLWTRAEDLRVRRRAEAALERVGVPASVMERELRSLSHGQLKMVDIARALLAEPSVLLLDEPTSGLNEDEIERSRELIRELRQQGLTVLVVEHNIQFVLDLADRLAVLDRGHLIALGEPRQTLRRRDVAEAYLGPAASKRHGLEDAGHASEEQP